MQEGTLLGAVKLSAILPWERDADVAILSRHFHTLISHLQSRKSKKIGKLKIHTLPYLNDSVVTGGSAVINTKNWVIGKIRIYKVFENHRKSLILHCERSELRLHLEWTKVN